MKQLSFMLRLGIFSIALALFTLGCANKPQPITITGDFSVTDINIVSMANEQVLSKQTIVIKDNRIVKIMADEANVNLIVTQKINGQGRFLLPGLSDMHSHLRMQPQAMFNQYLANGVTTVRNLRIKDGNYDHVALREKIKQGEMIAPRYLVSGPQLKPENIPDLTAAEKMMDFYTSSDFDVVKIHADLPKDIYDLVLKRAEKHNMMVTGHTQHSLPFSEALRMDSIEHVEELLYANMHAHYSEDNDWLKDYSKRLPRFDLPNFRHQLIKQLADSGTSVVTTLTIYHALTDWVDNQRFVQLSGRPENIYLPKWIKKQYLNDDTNPYREEGFPLNPAHLQQNNKLLRQLVFEMHQQGVPLILGVDAFGTVVPGFAVHGELSLLVAAGLTPYQALQTGTINVAHYLGEAAERGTIEEGKLADFFIIAENPLSDIAHTKAVQGVFTHGKWHNRAALDVMLNQAAELNLK